MSCIIKGNLTHDSLSRGRPITFTVDDAIQHLRQSSGQIQTKDSFAITFTSKNLLLLGFWSSKYGVLSGSSDHVRPTKHPKKVHYHVKSITPICPKCPRWTTFTHAHYFLSTFHHIYRCLPLVTLVSRCTPMFTLVTLVSPHLPTFTWFQQIYPCSSLANLVLLHEKFSKPQNYENGQLHYSQWSCENVTPYSSTSPLTSHKKYPLLMTLSWNIFLLQKKIGTFYYYKGLIVLTGL